MNFLSIPEAITRIARGEIVVVVDDENRENEGDLVAAASKVSPETINFMISHGRGLVCMPVDESIAKRLKLVPMSDVNECPYSTAFTMSVDAKEGTSTGISAFDRALTIQKLIDGESVRGDFIVPGHVFPLLAKRNGVLERCGHTEAAVDLAKLAGLAPAGVICEIIRDDGHMARLADLHVFCAQFNLGLVKIDDLHQYRKEHNYDAPENVVSFFERATL